MELNNYIKWVRETLGLTPTEFAKILGRTRPTIVKYEKGKLIPPGNILLKIQALEKK